MQPLVNKAKVDQIVMFGNRNVTVVPGDMIEIDDKRADRMLACDPGSWAVASKSEPDDEDKGTPSKKKK